MKLSSSVIVACAAALSLGCAAAPAKTSYNYVIVHGAWGGGWDWKAMDSLLTAQGHRVHRVTLTGLGERMHLASPNIGLTTHIDDVVNTIQFEELKDVVLVGHSYGGMVVTGVADRIPERLRAVIYMDAFLPESGESVMQLTGTQGATFFTANVKDGLIIPPWVPAGTPVPRDVPHPLKTFMDTLRLTNPAAKNVKGSYILTIEKGATRDDFSIHADRAKARGWPVHQMTADHVPERSARAELLKLLLQVP
jgi:pimeloyl-ACP methyl ester carboxylesterase